MNPLTTEQQFQLLQQSLPLIASRRTKLLRILEFLESLTQPLDRAALRAYAPELLQSFLRELGRVDLAATPLSFARRLRKILDILHAQLPDAADEESWRSATAAVVREQASVLALLKQKASQGTLAPVHAKLEKTHEAHGGAVRPGVMIPVVEREFLLRSSEAAFAGLRSIHVEIHFSRNVHGEDEILVDQVFDPDGTQHRQVRQAVRLARLLLRQFAGITDGRRLIVHCTFDEPNVIAGESLGAALTFAVFEELVRVFRLRETVSLRPDVAVTGVTDPEGNLQTVDEHGLRLKVQACAFSRVRFLVVPREQQSLAMSALEDVLREEGGLPSLVIVGVSTLDEVLFDRRLTTVRRIALPVYLFERVWVHRRPLFVAILIALLTTVLYLWFGPIDQTPDRIEFAQGDILVQNRQGSVLERIRIGTAMAKAAPGVLESQRSSQLAVIADVDGDGTKEVLAVRETDEGTAVSNELCCWRLGSVEPIWTYAVRHHITVPNITEPLDDRFSIQGFVVDDVNGDGNLDVVVIACHPKRYPAVLTLLRASSGEESARYLHMGALKDVAVAQLAGDSVKSIVACGINNPFRQACLLVLDPHIVRGVCPTAPPWTPKDFTRGTEKYYILFPRTIVGDAFPTQNYGNIGMRVRVSKEGWVRVAIEDFKAYVPGLGQTVSGEFTCVLGRGMKPLGVDRSELLNLTAESLEEKGRIPRTFDDRYFADYEKTLRFWDGKEWVNHPAVNQWKMDARPSNIHH